MIDSKKTAKELIKEVFLKQTYCIEKSILDVLDKLRKEGNLDEYASHIHEVVNKYRNIVK